jgi:hypothetical protein
VTRRAPAAAGGGRGRARPSLDLIHRSKVSAAAGADLAEQLARAADVAAAMVPATAATRLAERLGRAAAAAAQAGQSSFFLDVGPGDSQAVAECVAEMRRKLEAGDYDR